MDEAKKRTFYKHCIAMKCGSNTSSSPGKAFIRVPMNRDLRQKWLNAVGRKSYEFSSTNFSIFVCEDHFDLESDMENYSEWKLTKEKEIMKKTALPRLIEKVTDELQNKTDTNETDEQLGLHQEFDIKIELDTTDGENLSTCVVPGKGLAQERNIQESEVVSPVKSQDIFQAQKTLEGKETAQSQKEVVCPLCSKIVSRTNLSRHIQRHHKQNKEVRLLKKLDPESEEVSALRKGGFFRLKIERNVIIPREEYFPCNYCPGRYPLRFLDAHEEYCKERPMENDQLYRLSQVIHQKVQRRRKRVSKVQQNAQKDTESEQNVSSSKSEESKYDFPLPFKIHSVESVKEQDEIEPLAANVCTAKPEQEKCEEPLPFKILSVESVNDPKEQVDGEPKAKKISSSKPALGKYYVRIPVERFPLKAKIKKRSKVPREKKPRKVQWTEEEKSLVRKHFSKLIGLKKPPKKLECEEFLKLYPHLYKGRGWIQLKAFVYNCYRIS